MPISVRLAMPEDREQLLELARLGAAETEPEIGWDETATNETIAAAIETGSPTIYVADAGGRLLGLILCTIGGFAFTTGIKAVLQILYVRPESRGSRAAALLLSQFVEWSEIVGAKRSYLSIDNNPRPVQALRFFKRFGARPTGISMVI